MTTVRVRLFAALRDAAGAAEVEVEAGPLPVVLDGLRARFGEPFTSRLARSTVVVDGEPTPAAADLQLHPGQEVVLLPPFSGG